MLLDRIFRDPDSLQADVAEVMAPPLPMVEFDAPMEVAFAELQHGPAVIVAKARRGARRAHALGPAGVPRAPRADEGLSMRFETRAIHAGQEPEPTYGAVNVPIYQTSTYAQSRGRRAQGLRLRANARTRPARRSQEAIASLEEGRGALAFASGMAAEATFFHLLSPGDHVVVGDDVYGGTYRLFARVLTDSAGIQFDAVDLTDLDAVRKAVREETKVVWTESPTNPMLKIIDIAAVAEIAHGSGARCVVDNTFVTPYLQQPLALGADAVVHSSTKYLGGHSDVVGGVIVANDPGLLERLRSCRTRSAPCPGRWTASWCSAG